VDARLGLQDLVDLAHDGVRPLHRRGLGKLHVHEEEALVLLGHERRGQGLAETAREQRERDEHEQRDRDLADEELRAPDVDRLHRREGAIEPDKEPSSEPAARLRQAADGDEAPRDSV
jgi:hypothetical protein